LTKTYRAKEDKTWKEIGNQRVGVLILPEPSVKADGMQFGGGILGMIAGAALFAEFFPVLKKTVLKWVVYGKITIPEALGINHWIVIVIFIISGLLLFRWFEKKKL
jgi:hypothetical protein